MRMYLYLFIRLLSCESITDEQTTALFNYMEQNATETTPLGSLFSRFYRSVWCGSRADVSLLYDAEELLKEMRA